jgi:cytochrome c556
MFNFLNTADPKANRNRLVLLLVVVMIVGMIAGVTMNRAPAAPAQVTTQTVTQDKTPEACADYIEHSEEGFSLAQESMTYAGDAFRAIADYDLTAAKQASENMRSVKPKLDALAPLIQQSKADCLAAK